MDERTGDPGEFMSHPRWHRFLIAIAGPAMNILLAIFLLTTVYMVHYEYPVFMDKPAVIEGVKHNSAAAQAGLQPGDRIVKIDGIANPTWEQLQPRVLHQSQSAAGGHHPAGRSALEKTIVPKPMTTSEVGSAGWYPAEPVIVGQVETRYARRQGGLKEDDRIVALDGKPLVSIEAMIERLQQTKDTPVDLTVMRGDQTLTFRLQAGALENGRSEGAEISPGIPEQGRDQSHERCRSSRRLSLSLEENKKYSLLLLELAKKIVQGKVSLQGRLRPDRYRAGCGLCGAAKGLDAADGA